MAPTDDGSPRARLLVTGDELLRGFIQDANTGFLAAQLRDAGIELDEIRILGDEHDVIGRALDRALTRDRVDLLVVTGGLGPTHDDRTSEAVARACGVELELFDDALAVVETRVRAYGRMRTPEEVATFTPGNRKQATLPAGATWVDPLGTAPGYAVATESGQVIVVLPGPPAELRHAWAGVRDTPQLQRLQERVGDRHERLIRLWGVPESRASQALAQLDHEDSPERRVTICARDGELEISVRGSDVDGVDGLVGGLREALDGHVFAVDDERSIVAMLADQLAERSWSLATCESCTGGMVGELLTSAAGSSAWYRGGLVTYANEAKVALAGVDPALLEQHGAVSEPVARAMAGGARAALGADVGLGVTGIAGPGGGSDEKPVGTVHLSVVTPDGDWHRRVRIPGDRATVRRRSSLVLLHELRAALAGPGGR